MSALESGWFEKKLTAAKGLEPFSGPFEVAASLAAHLDARLARAEVLSLDVFDTVLLRDGQSELKRFFDVAERFAARVAAEFGRSVSAEACLVARVVSAHVAYTHSQRVDGAIEGRLDDIARNMMHTLHLSAEAVDLWIDTELAVEAEQLRLSPFVDAWITRARAAGKRVIFVSDMYLNASQIRRLLDAAGCELARIEQVISSADRVVNKRSGTIFGRLETELGVAGRAILHAGDSPVSDYRRPLEAGWQAQLLPLPREIMRQRVDCHARTCERLFGRPDFPLPMARPTA